jgi:hypothetical protein
MSEQNPTTLFLHELRAQLLEAVKPRRLVLYGVALVIFSIVSFVLPYQIQVYTSISAGIIVVLLLVAALVKSRGFRKLDMIFVGGIFFLIVALLPKEYFISSFPTPEFFRDFRHLSEILSITLTALYALTGILQFLHTRIQGTPMKYFSDFFSVCNTTISSELCGCLHPIPFVDTFLAPLGVADLLTNRVKLGFVMMMTCLVFQMQSFYASYKTREKKTPNANTSTR